MKYFRRIKIDAIIISTLAIENAIIMDNISQQSQHFGVTLSDLGDEYAQLLAETGSNGNLSQKQKKDEDKNLRWTRVITKQHFQIAGAREFMV